MADDEPWEFVYPHVSRAMARTIGEFFIAWGTLERELDDSFPVLFRIDPTLAACIYANLTTKTKLDILSSALSMLAPALPAEFVKDAHDCLGMMRDYASNARNVLAHAQPSHVGGPDKKKRYWQLGRSVARKKHELVYYPSDPDHWTGEACMVAMLAEHWAKISKEIYFVTRKLTAQQWDDLCVTSARWIEPKFQRPRRTPPPKKGGSKGRQPKNGKPLPSP